LARRQLISGTLRKHQQIRHDQPDSPEMLVSLEPG